MLRVDNALNLLATPPGFELGTLRLGSRGRLSQFKVILTVRATFTPWRVNHLSPESERRSLTISVLNVVIDPAPKHGPDI